MSDVMALWQEGPAHADLVLSGRDLASGGDLVNAVIISLFSERTAGADDVAKGEDPRGWWGGVIGSRLYLLERVKLTADVAKRARDYAIEGLQWLIDNGIAVKIDVQAEIVKPKQLSMQVTVFRRDGSKVAQSYAWAWNQ